MLSVHITGDYRHRQPLAYSALRPLWDSWLEITPDMAKADLVIVAHPRDLDTHGATLKATLGTGQRLVLLSEEPFWDTVWGADPFVRAAVHDTDAGALPYVQLNHLTSDLYDFARLPYFVLTNRSYFNRYALRFGRNATRSVADWRAHFNDMTKIVFMAERRKDAKFDRCFTDAEVFGLSAQRTRLTEAIATRLGDCVTCFGHGWDGNTRRQDLHDWHLQKLHQLDGCTRVLSAMENTHLPSYVTEKLFDAFATGAWPLYIARANHRVDKLVPRAAWTNLVGLDPDAAAETVAVLVPDPAAYAEAQARLAALFSPAVLASERARLGRALRAELMAVAGHG